MYNISVEQHPNCKMKLMPMSIKRDWMDQTSENHAYRCFPVTQANIIGWSISCIEDISFIWNGINDQSGDTIEILQGKDFCYTGRGQSSVSFNTSLTFKTEETLSLLTINPVNYFNGEFEIMSSLITSSFMDSPLPLAIKALSANKEILIKAGTPLATIIPISLTALNNSVIEINEYQDPDQKRRDAMQSYGEAAQIINKSGAWTDWYRDAVDENGKSLGRHEVKTLRLHVVDNISEQ